MTAGPEPNAEQFDIQALPPHVLAEVLEQHSLRDLILLARTHRQLNRPIIEFIMEMSLDGYYPEDDPCQQLIMLELTGAQLANPKAKMMWFLMRSGLLDNMEPKEIRRALTNHG